MMRRSFGRGALRLLTSLGITALLLLYSLTSCSKQQEPAKLPPGNPTTEAVQVIKPYADTSVARLNVPPPTTGAYFVLDQRSRTIFGIDLNTNKVVSRLPISEPVVQIQYDPHRNWIYEAVTGPQPGLNVYDVGGSRYIQKFRFPGAPRAMCYHPLQQRLYVVSEDSSNVRVFVPDSMKFVLGIPLSIQNQTPIKPTTLQPGPMGKLIMANGARSSVTQLFTEHNFMHQTVVVHNAIAIDQAFFSFDGNSAFCTDTKQGALYRIEFGSGKILGEMYKLDRPRFVQLDVPSNTVVVTVGATEILMLNSDTFRETGRINLSEYGDEILSFEIPPKANYAELLLDYKGVTRWVRFDVKTWEVLRLVELY